MWSRFTKRLRVRWKALLALLVLAAVAAVGGGYAYATHQWRAAQLALKQDRAADARKHLARCLLIWPRSAKVHLLAARAARLTGDMPNAERHLNRCLALERRAER